MLPQSNPPKMEPAPTVAAARAGSKGKPSGLPISILALESTNETEIMVDLYRAIFEYARIHGLLPGRQAEGSKKPCANTSFQ
jgi:hypothetical protein